MQINKQSTSQMQQWTKAHKMGDSVDQHISPNQTRRQPSFKLSGTTAVNFTNNVAFNDSIKDPTLLYLQKQDIVQESS